MEIPIRKPFGVMPDGSLINSYTLENRNGMEFTTIEYGAAITSLKIPIQNGGKIDVVLGFDTLEDYLKSIALPAPPHFGAAIGRWAGRINKGVFRLNEKTFRLKPNNNGHSLHGGRYGFSQVAWTLKQISTDGNPSVTFTYFSKHQDENFPGNLNVEVTYTLSGDNELIVDFKAEADQDTIVNMTQHSYFNLNGHDSSIADQLLQINAGKTLETTGMIPTGKISDVRNTEFDFTALKQCPQNIDATFVLDKMALPDSCLYSPQNNLKMSVSTTQPAVHIYVGGDLFNRLKGKSGVAYHPLSGICFETQNFPDAINQPHFPDPILRKGQTYQHRTTYKFDNAATD